MNNLQDKLTDILPEKRIKTRLIDRVAYANDASYFRLVPQAVVQPESISEIQSLFRFSHQTRIPMTFRAAGTNLTGQAITDGILVDVSKHWDTYSIEDNGASLRAQPGLIGGFLNNVLKAHGRRIGPDPASIDACMLGGILSNNSGGMCCGVTENSYKTIRSMTLVFPNGFVLDTSDSNAKTIFENEQPLIAQGLMDIRQRILANPKLTERIHRRYQSKNTNGYSLHAFVDFDNPLDILVHLIIGSEGTLAFIAEAVLRTLPVLTHKYTALLLFQTVQDAAAAIYPLRESGARAAEILDRAALRSVETIPGVPTTLRELPESAAAILVEYQAPDGETLLHFKKEAARIMKNLRLLQDPEFTEDPIEQANLWKPRKGIIASVGAMRAPGTTSLIEDVLFPVPRLAEAVTDLQALFAEHGYPEGVIFGHAKDGNLHFLINQSFNTQENIKQFDDFTNDLVRLVTEKYDGALKAEHGSGRNMAPFVETEWGAEAYSIMRNIKSLFDPDGLLNPDVLINPNPQAHITDAKRIVPVSPIVDACIECGFCESKCPSRRLTLSPRQRIIIQREIAQLREVNNSDSSKIASLLNDYTYDGLDTCAVDGLCAIACPVGINTGEMTKQLRAEKIKNEKVASWIGKNFSLIEKAVGWGVRLGHFIEPKGNQKPEGKLFITSTTEAIEKITGQLLPKWNHSVPYPTKNLRELSEGMEDKDFIYFPSCISRQLGTPTTKNLIRGDRQMSLAEALTTVANRAGVSLEIPDDVSGVCCGMPFSSKGYRETYKDILHKTVTKFWEWSDDGKFPIVIDTTSCTHSLHSIEEYLTQNDQERFRKLTILDSLELIHDTLLSKLVIHPIEEDVVLHPNCSARTLGLDEKMLSIAQTCTRSVAVPLNLGCCAFAGDRGLLHPELTASATEQETAEVLEGNFSGHFSSNITCEMGMSEVTGKDYMSIVYMVEKVTR
jgi:D-lactate dehydrogenase